jgi:hypothetical protein
MMPRCVWSSLNSWPRFPKYSRRFRVPDLKPPGGPGSRGNLVVIFVGESPHRDEVAPTDPRERTPFRGAAGRAWWSELAKFLKHPKEVRPVPPRPVLLEICAELRIAMINAVQFPLDPKIALHQGRQAAPIPNLGFEKGPGRLGYKAVWKKSGQKGPVGMAVSDLAKRLRPLQAGRARIVCLGNDSCWFVERALELLDPAHEIRVSTVPHPSCWWRKASYRRRAIEALSSILTAPG